MELNWNTIISAVLGGIIASPLAALLNHMSNRTNIRLQHANSITQIGEKERILRAEQLTHGVQAVHRIALCANVE